MQADSIYWVRSAGDCKVQLHHSHRHTHSHMSGPHHDLVIVCSPLLPACLPVPAGSTAQLDRITHTHSHMHACTHLSQLLRPAYGVRIDARAGPCIIATAVAACGSVCIVARTTRCVPAVQCSAGLACVCMCMCGRVISLVLLHVRYVPTVS